MFVKCAPDSTIKDSGDQLNSFKCVKKWLFNIFLEIEKIDSK